MFVVLASEPVGGRSRVTELSCLQCMSFNLMVNLSLKSIQICQMLFIMLCQLSTDTCKCSNTHIKSAEYEICVINQIKCYKFETELSLFCLSSFMSGSSIKSANDIANYRAIVLYSVIDIYPDNIILFKNMDYYFMSEP